MRLSPERVQKSVSRCLGWDWGVPQRLMISEVAKAGWSRPGVGGRTQVPKIQLTCLGVVLQPSNSQAFWSQDPFTLLKFENPKKLLCERVISTNIY